MCNWVIFAPAGRAYSLTPKPLWRSAGFHHTSAHDEPGIGEVWANLTHELEDTRILSITDDGYRGLKRVVWNE